MADHFARPLRLTRQEALAVYVRATELAATPGMPEAPALTQRAGQAPRARSGPETLGDAAGHRRGRRRVGAAAPRRGPGRRRRIGERLRIAYAAASTGERTERRDRPGGRVRQLGPVVRGRLGRRRRRRAAPARGPDRRGATRRATDSSRAASQGRGGRCTRPGRRTSASGFGFVRQARWVAEYYVATDPVEEDDGNLVVTLPTGQVTWARAAVAAAGAATRTSSSPTRRARGGPRAGPGDACPLSGLTRSRSATWPGNPALQDSRPLRCPPMFAGEMTTIRTTCPRCGEVDMGPESILLSVRSNGREGSYRFTCPECEDAVEKRADRKIVALLVSAGVDIDRDDEIAPMHPELFDADRPDERSPRPAGPVVHTGRRDRVPLPARGRRATSASSSPTRG